MPKDLSKKRRKKVGPLVPVARQKVVSQGRPSVRNIVVRERERRALELRKSGATYQQIADSLGYSSASTAFTVVKRAMGRIIVESTAELRAVQYERLNHMLMVIWHKINNGDERAIETGLRVMDKIDRLMGVEVPTRQEVQHSGGVLVIQTSPDAYVAGLQQMAGIQDTSSIQEPKELLEANPSSLDGDVGDVIDAIEASGVLESESSNRNNGKTPKAKRTNNQNGKAKTNGDR